MSLRIAIVAPSAVPPVEGGAERLWRSLANALRAAGHQAEVVSLPFPETTLREVLDGYAAFGDLDLTSFDVVVSGKYPAWMVDHPNHVLYMVHPLRGLYDTYPSHLGELRDHADGVTLAAQLDAATDASTIIEITRSALADFGDNHPLSAYPGPLARHAIHRLDQTAFTGEKIRSFTAMSEEVAGRSDYLPPGVSVLVNHPESDLFDQAALADRPSPAVSPDALEGPVFFTASRHDHPKRIDLIIRSFRRLTDERNDRQLSLLIAGDGPERAALERAAGANERIHFLGRVSEAALATYYRDADVVVFTPDREDFGYISLEAMEAGTPVLTTTDSGGANELLDDGVGGLVVEPTESALAAAMDRMADDPHLRWQLGLNGRRRAATVSWEPLVRTITEAGTPSQRPNVTILSTFAVSPTIGGGQRRVRHLARSLGLTTNVSIVCLTNATPASAPVRRRVIDPGVNQIEVPRSAAHREAEAEINRVTGFPVDDITSSRLWASTPEFAAVLRHELDRSDLVINAHPFLSTAVSELLNQSERSVPVVYDSHNAEAAFKRTVLDQRVADGTMSREAADWLIDAVTHAETTAVGLASHIVACTEADLDTVLALDTEGGATTEMPRTTAVVANGVDTSAMRLRTAEDHRAARLEALGLFGVVGDDDRPLAVFIGSWHPPNLDAAALIVGLARQRPDWIFGLAGSHTLAFEHGTSTDGSVLPENVRQLPTFAEESLWPLLAGADVALNPMVSGGGSNLKLFDYLAVGVPVLTTRTGCRGLDRPDEVAWIAEPTVASMSDVLDAITGDDDARARRSTAGRERAQATVDWRDLGERWSAGFARLLPPSDPTMAPRSPATTHPPFLSTEPPPPAEPTIELMSRLASMAVSPNPPPETSTMNPTLRENLRRMSANRHAGRDLPANARLRIAKSALIRIGHSITNEQVVFNEAAVAVVNELSEEVAALRQQLAEQQHLIDGVDPDAASTTT